jgi:hypothetical protein
VEPSTEPPTTGLNPTRPLALRYKSVLGVVAHVSVAHKAGVIALEPTEVTARLPVKPKMLKPVHVDKSEGE